MGESGLTYRRERLVDAVVAGARTQQEAGRKAFTGSDKSISVSTSRALADARVIAAIESRKKGQRDKVRTILSDSVDVTSAALKHPDADPMFALAAMKTSADVLDRLPEDPPRPATGRELADCIRAAYLAACRHALAGRIAPWAAAALGIGGVATGDAPGDAGEMMTRSSSQISTPCDPSHAVETSEVEEGDVGGV